MRIMKQYLLNGTEIPNLDGCCTVSLSLLVFLLQSVHQAVQDLISGRQLAPEVGRRSDEANKHLLFLAHV